MRATTKRLRLKAEQVARLAKAKGITRTTLPESTLDNLTANGYGVGFTQPNTGFDCLRSGTNRELIHFLDGMAYILNQLERNTK